MPKLLNVINLHTLKLTAMKKSNIIDKYRYLSIIEKRLMFMKNVPNKYE